jgi:hypothetical protein
MDEAKGWFFLIFSFLFLMMICAIAAVSLVLRPARWTNRFHRAVV